MCETINFKSDINLIPEIKGGVIGKFEPPAVA